MAVAALLVTSMPLLASGAKKNADGSMNWIKCVYLGLQLGEFRKNFEAFNKD